MDRAVKDLLQAAQHGIPVAARAWQLQNDVSAQTVEEIDARMLESLHVMRDSAMEGLNPELRSVSGLTGANAPTVNGKKQKSYAQQLLDSFAKSASTGAGRETGRTLARNLLGIFGLSSTGKRK